MSIGFSYEELQERLDRAMKDLMEGSEEAAQIKAQFRSFVVPVIGLIALNNRQIEYDLKRIGLIPESV